MYIFYNENEIQQEHINTKDVDIDIVKCLELLEMEITTFDITINEKNTDYVSVPFE